MHTGAAASVIGCSHDRASLERQGGAGKSRLVADEALGGPRVKNGRQRHQKKTHAACADLGGSFCGSDKGRHAHFRIWKKARHGEQTCTWQSINRGRHVRKKVNPRAERVPAVATKVSHGHIAEDGIVAIRFFLFWGSPHNKQTKRAKKLVTNLKWSSTLDARTH